jgi:hypothetical protein
MKTLRSPVSTYAAAFLLGGLIALLLAWPARAAEPFRLDRLGIVQFSPTEDGRLTARQGVLTLSGEIHWRGTSTLARPANTPAWALNRTLVSVTAWQAFLSLGTGATADFEIKEGGVRAYIGDEAYLAVASRSGATVPTGALLNLSTRTRLNGGAVVIAGFVVDERPRAVLVRAIGPGLARFNVPGAHPDPWLTVKRNGQTIVGNDDWTNQADRALVEAIAARVGAFPLEQGSYDAAQFVILPPGAYTVHVGSDRSDVFSGEVLVEIYSVPADVFDSN